MNQGYLLLVRATHFSTEVARRATIWFPRVFNTEYIPVQRKGIINFEWHYKICIWVIIGDSHLGYNRGFSLIWLVEIRTLSIFNMSTSLTGYVPLNVMYSVFFVLLLFLYYHTRADWDFVWTNFHTRSSCHKSLNSRHTPWKNESNYNPSYH